MEMNHTLSTSADGPGRVDASSDPDPVGVARCGRANVSNTACVHKAKKTR